MKQINNIIYCSLLVILLTLLLTINFSAKGVLCALNNVEGFEQERENGNLYISNGYTSGSAELEFYVTAKGDSLFLQSNFKPKDFEYPIKLVSTELGDLKIWAKNIITFGGQLKLPRGFNSVYSKDSTLYFDIDLLTNPKFKDLNLGKSNNVYYVDNKGGKWLLKTTDNQKYLEITSNISIKFPSSDPQKIMEFKQEISEITKRVEQSFNKENIKLLAIVNEIDTQEAISKKIPSKNVIKTESYTIENFSKIFEQNEGKRVFLLGHFDSQKEVFVATDEFDKTIAEVNFNELKEIAKKYKVKLFPLGCETGKSIGELGTLQKFNSLDAVNRLQTALNSNNWREFFNFLGKDDLKFIVTNSFLEDNELGLELDIMKNGRKVGSVRVAIPDDKPIEKTSTPQPCLENSETNINNSDCSNRDDRSIFCAFPVVFVMAILLIGTMAGYILSLINKPN